MTYSLLDSFVTLFKSNGEKYRLSKEECIGTPLTSEYSKHLSGDTVLYVSSENTRFAIAQIKGGTIPYDTPAVVFEKDDTNYVALFLKDCRTDSFEQLKRITDYYCVKIEKPEFYELPFYMASLDYFTPLDENGYKFKYISDAIEFCQKKVVSVKQIDYWEKELPYRDAPFCVQSYYLHHKGLPSFAAPYLDAKKLPIEDANTKDWWAKYTAPYKCPNAYCNRDKCSCRKYGVGSNEISELEFGQLTQYAEEPVVYKWLINGSEMRFYNEIDIINQDRFLRLCMRSLGVLPHKLKAQTWLRIINKALANMRVIGEADTAKLTIEHLNDIVVNKLKDRILVSSYFEYERLMQGYIYLDPATSNFVVHATAFCSYVMGKYKDLRIESSTEFYSIMKHLGFKGKQRDIDGSKTKLMYARSRFLFKGEQEWKDFLLDVSKNTIWEENFKAFLLGDNEVQEEISDIEREEVLNDAAVFLDTEANK